MISEWAPVSMNMICDSIHHLLPQKLLPGGKFVQSRRRAKHLARTVSQRTLKPARTRSHAISKRRVPDLQTSTYQSGQSLPTSPPLLANLIYSSSVTRPHQYVRDVQSPGGCANQRLSRNHPSRSTSRILMPAARPSGREVLAQDLAQV